MKKKEEKAYKLSHYFRVLKGYELPLFKACSKIKTGLSGDKISGLFKKPPDSSLFDEMLSKHDKLISDLYGREKQNYPDDSKYISLLDLKTALGFSEFNSCRLCEHRCEVNRWDERGVCGAGPALNISSEFLHLGEERELVPSYTLFFSGCNFSCVYCQNYDIANSPDSGREIKPTELARLINRKSIERAKNVNFVGGEPTPRLPLILKTINQMETSLPVVWNSNMYMSSISLNLLTGAVDLYLADLRYGNDDCAKKYSGVENYWNTVSRNIFKASGVGDLIIRHLVLPGHIDCCTKKVLKWISGNLPDVYVNVMFQYRPCYRAFEFSEINRRLSFAERERVKYLVKEMGLEGASVG